MSRIEIYEGSERDALNKYLLDRYTLREGTLYSKIALVKRIQQSFTYDQKPFYKIVLVDKNGNLFTTRLFRVENYEESGKAARELEGRVVKIDFETQVYQGELQGTLNSIDVIEESVGITRNYFVGRIDDVDLYLKYIRDILDIDDQFKLYCEAIKQNNFLSGIELRNFTIYNEKVGGYLKFITKVLQTAESYLKDKPEILQRARVTIIIIACLTQRQMGKGETGYIKVKTLRDIFIFLEAIEKLGKEEWHKKFSEECIDIAQALMKMEKPRSYLAHTIVTIYEQIYRLEQLADINDFLIVNSSKTTDNGDTVTRLY